MTIVRNAFRAILFVITLLMIALIIYGISTHAILNYGAMAMIAAISGKWADSLR